MCFGSGLPSIRCFFSANAFGGAVAALRAVRRCAVNLHKLRVMNGRAECAFHRLRICLVAVTGHLNAIGEPVGDVG